jgi:hypothetical protein
MHVGNGNSGNDAIETDGVNFTGVYMKVWNGIETVISVFMIDGPTKNSEIPTQNLCCI